MDFNEALQEIFAAAEKQGKSKIAVNSGLLHRRVGGYPGSHHRMPTCCSAMRAAMRHGDIITASPPKGNGASLTIEYQLPRSSSRKTAGGEHREKQNEKTSNEKTESGRTNNNPHEIFAYFNCTFPPQNGKRLRESYLHMIKENHPDKVADMSKEFIELAEKKTKEINDMYDKALAYLKTEGKNDQ